MHVIVYLSESLKSKHPDVPNVCQGMAIILGESLRPVADRSDHCDITKYCQSQQMTCFSWGQWQNWQQLSNSIYSKGVKYGTFSACCHRSIHDDMGYFYFIGVSSAASIQPEWMDWCRPARSGSPLRSTCDSHFTGNCVLKPQAQCLDFFRDSLTHVQWRQTLRCPPRWCLLLCPSSSPRQLLESFFASNSHFPLLEFSFLYLGLNDLFFPITFPVWLRNTYPHTALLGGP